MGGTLIRTSPSLGAGMGMDLSSRGALADGRMAAVLDIVVMVVLAFLLILLF